MNLLPMYDFVTSGIVHLKNTGSRGFAGFANVDIFHYTIQKITLIISPLSPIRKVYKYWQSLGARQATSENINRQQ